MIQSLERDEIEKFADRVVAGDPKACKANELLGKGVRVIATQEDPVICFLILWTVLDAVREAIQ